MKIYKIKRSAIFTAMILLGSLNAQAGGVGTSGGGKGVLCGGKLRSLDLYEAEEIHRLHITRTASDLQSALDIYLPKINTYFTHSNFDGGAYDSQNHWDHDSNMDYLKRVIIDKFKDIPEGMHLPLTEDATVQPLPPNCAIVQILVLKGAPHPEESIASFLDHPSVILRDRTYWDLLSPEDRAAMILHEDAYAVQGPREGLKSDDVRRLIGLIFSDQPLKSFISYHDSEDLDFCDMADHLYGYGAKPAQRLQESFYFTLAPETRDGQTGIAIYFPRFKGVEQVFELSAFLPNYTVDEFENARHLTLKFRAFKPVTGESYQVEIRKGSNTHRIFSNAGSVSIRAWSENEAPPAFSWGSCERPTPISPP